MMAACSYGHMAGHMSLDTLTHHQSSDRISQSDEEYFRKQAIDKICVVARLGGQIGIQWATARRAVCGGSCHLMRVAVLPIAPSTCKGVRVLHTYQRTIKIKLSWLSTGICLLTRGISTIAPVGRYQEAT